MLLILILAVSSLIMAKPAFAQTPSPTPTPVSTLSPTPVPTTTPTPTPTPVLTATTPEPPVPTETPYPTVHSSTLQVPQFTIQLGNHSYEVPPVTTTTTNPYTGQQTTTTQPGYYVENETIDFTIVNQPHTSVFVPEYYGIDLYYDIRYKGHFEDTWTELYTYDEDENILPTATNSTYTLISIPQSYPFDAQVDFQIRAINGTITSDYPGINQPFAYWTYQSSGWSNIETINVTDGSVTITPFSNPTPIPTSISTSSPTPMLSPTSTSTPSPTPTVPEFPALMILPLFAVVILLSIVARKRNSLRNVSD